MFRLGLIGAGRMGRTHLRALAGSTTVAVAAVVEPVAAERAAIAGTGRTVFEDVAQLLDAGGIDGVLIAAPSDRHVEFVAQVAAAGLPILIGDHFAVLSLGRMSLNARRDEITIDQLINEMAGGSELTALAQQLSRGTVPGTA